MPKLKLHTNEKLLSLPLAKSPKGFRYAVTTYGRIISFISEPEDGRFLNPARVSGYPAVAIRTKKGNKTYYIHRLVAKYFLRQPTPQHKFVIHLNHKKDDNFIQNLKWVTRDEQIRHAIKDRRAREVGNYKLSEAKVRMIKKKLLNGKTRLKMIGKQFGVSDMQIHRIKTGENWGHVKI